MLACGDGTRPSTRLRNLQGGYLLSLERGSRNLEDEEDVATRKCGSGKIGGGDPYAPGVAEKYSLTSCSETDGFDESADAVGPGIYGGSVQRDASGTVLLERSTKITTTAPDLSTMGTATASWPGRSTRGQKR